jgi:uncharacterized lipoprotein YmbA
MRNIMIYTLGLTVILAACATPQARFYHLTPVDNACIACDAKAYAPATISIGPVTIPDRIDRSQIVTLAADSEVDIAQFDRWAGSINDEIVRTMTINISKLLPVMNVVPYDMEKWVSPDYQIRVDILGLDITPGKAVLLTVNYSVTDKTRKTLLLKSASITEPTGNTYPEMVQSQSRVFGTLSSQIAQAFLTLTKETAPDK